MSTGEYQSISDAITELKKDFKEFRKDFDDFRVQISDNYTKKEENDNAHRSFTGWIIGIYAMVIGIIGTFFMKR